MVTRLSHGLDRRVTMAQQLGRRLSAPFGQEFCPKALSPYHGVRKFLLVDDDVMLKAKICQLMDAWQRFLGELGRGGFLYGFRGVSERQVRVAAGHSLTGEAQSSHTPRYRKSKPRPCALLRMTLPRRGLRPLTS